ncbi:hypothetical protein [Christiangramia forsetii]|uniref:Uncharacterized protein n=2 Tax=Christiangramia forsetii TaxID=411153 RepID=A0LYV4_CHRFK|nr:hypothetical protein [Christiangramia forsetii]GGG33262.1 hypothetical protein GCM10011532_16130 [Christiangramia forsetii]CAL65549.1 conserved hypothetical protein [Christiangramia forsetii KT0803]
MIIISKPKLEEKDDKVILSVDFEIEGGKKKLWYSFSSNYKEYLVVEQVDAFVVGLLFLGLKTGHDLKLEGPISARLFYSLNHYLIDAFCLVNPNYKRIKVIPSSLSTSDFNVANTAGTGLSCGIDSFATYFDHNDEVSPYLIEYFTFFNVGSHGDKGGDKARKIFSERFINVSQFAEKVNREVITVDSNLSEILQMKFQETYNLRTISCALLLQKLFKNYYYSSGTRFDHFAFNNKEIADLDMLIIPNLSTESTTFFVSALKYSRIDRTKLISEFTQTYEHLDVCTHPYIEGRDEINCSECYKCQRTMLTLEILGKLECYAKVFDLDKFRKNKKEYIGWLLSKKKKLTLDRELIRVIKEMKQIDSEIYFYMIKNMLYRQKLKLKKIFN